MKFFSFRRKKRSRQIVGLTKKTHKLRKLSQLDRQERDRVKGPIKGVDDCRVSCGRGKDCGCRCASLLFENIYAVKLVLLHYFSASNLGQKE